MPPTDQTHMSEPPTPLQPSRAALLVIDVQQGLFERPTSVYQAEALLENINALIETWQLSGGLVVFLQHSNNKFLQRGSPGWRFHPALRVDEADTLIQKTQGDAFQGTELKKLLDEYGLEHIAVSGLVTQGCVRATCLGGLKRGFRVSLVQGAHSTYSPDAAGVIAEWEANLAQAGVQVIPPKAIQSRFV